MRDENIPDEAARPRGPTSPGIDYQALFSAAPSPYVVLGPDLVISDLNEAYCLATGRTREDLLGRYFFDAFPDNPADPSAEGVGNCSFSNVQERA